MAKHIQLTIAEPCHENWDNMTPVEKGKFCGSCQKQVVDFTSMSDTQVAAFFKKPTTGSVCGRFMNDQLDRDITIPRKRIPWIKYFFQLSLPLFFASLKSTAQGNVSVRHVETTTVDNQHIKGGPVELTITERSKSGSLIHGMIVNEEGAPVPYASVMIKGTSIGVSADSTGVFSLQAKAIADSIILHVSSVGYADREVLFPTIDFHDSSMEEIKLEKQSLSEVIVIAYPTIRCWAITGAVTTVRSTVYTKDSLVTAPVEAAGVKIYPNPVTVGNVINIDCEKLRESYYSLKIFSLSGQAVLQKEIWIGKEVKTFQVTIPSVASGTYLVSMISRNTGKHATTKIIIQ